jgi:hypothetical protein
MLYLPHYPSEHKATMSTYGGVRDYCPPTAPCSEDGALYGSEIDIAHSVKALLLERH